MTSPALRPPPTEAQARAHLQRVIAIVQAGDLETLCELASGTCGTELRNADPARLPSDPPLVVGVAVVQPEVRHDGSTASGGLLLQLCGIDGLGDPYYSEMLVFSPDGRDLISVNTTYWLGMTIAGTGVSRPGPAALSQCP